MPTQVVAVTQRDEAPSAGRTPHTDTQTQIQIQIQPERQVQVQIQILCTIDGLHTSAGRDDGYLWLTRNHPGIAALCGSLISQSGHSQSQPLSFSGQTMSNVQDGDLKKGQNNDRNVTRSKLSSGLRGFFGVIKSFHLRGLRLLSYL